MTRKFFVPLMLALFLIAAFCQPASATATTSAYKDYITHTEKQTSIQIASTQEVKIGARSNLTQGFMWITFYQWDYQFGRGWVRYHDHKIDRAKIQANNGVYYFQVPLNKGKYMVKIWSTDLGGRNSCTIFGNFSVLY